MKPPTSTAARTTPRTTAKPIVATTAPPKSPVVTPKQPAAKVPAPSSPVSTVAAATNTAGSTAATDPHAAKTTVAPSDRFGIAVGTYLNPDRANAERTSLSESTQLPARVVTVAED